MVSPTPPDLAAVALAVLTSAATALGAGAPSRKYRSAGVPVYDFVSSGCDSQLTVMVGPTGVWPSPVTPARPELSPNRLRSTTLTVELARAIPVPSNNGTAPTAAALDAAGVQHCEDFRTLDLWKRSLGWSNHVAPDLSALGVQEVVDATVMTVSAQGGMVGIRATLVLVI